ncbi:hypothetical protein IR012_00815 [Pseudomonas putida]|uniref:hypothetical protein n=1 Tax=Pseudomonas putida TaxID=303 RepID=UPI0018AA16E0|nr:hypothetical protein [Pseudomonas putida]MBF8668318.1 hypothetical protein [Pseudomonas putida]MBF8710863.1 hypothetical protein [Pseudomonas putida]
MIIIFTLNARGNVFLETMGDHYKIPAPRMRKEIQWMFDTTVQSLANSGVSYEALRTILTPSTKKDEAAFLFDSTIIEDYSYGRVAMERLLPLLDPRSSHSILVGDLVGSNELQQKIHEILREQLVLARSYKYQHSANIFCIYVNNLSNASLERINEGLSPDPAYIGYIPTTYESRAKSYLSTVLGNQCIKHGNVMIIAHEDDRSNDENVNNTSYPFEDYGYKIRSIQQHYFSHFLSYKIERKPISGLEFDTYFSLNAISDNVSQLTGMDVLIEDAKFNYLITAGKLVKGGFTDIEKEELAFLVRMKIEDNYIYGLRYQKEHDVMSFNVVIELSRHDTYSPVRMNVGLEYRPTENMLRMITCF